MSVDALRGFDMFWIIGAATLVRAFGELGDNRATRFLSTQLEHAQWEGLRFYDTIYPLFLFLIGVSIVFSLDRSTDGGDRGPVVRRILRRGLVLYVLNFLYNGGFASTWPDMRIVSGVLAMIAASYVLAALIYCYFGRHLKILAAITAGLLLANWAILGLVPFPDFRLEASVVDALAKQAGSSNPAAVSAVVTQRVAGTYEEAHNVSNYLDYRFIPGKMPNRYYENQGLLSPLSAVTLCLGGIFAGRLLKNSRIVPRRKVLWLLVGGVGAIAVGCLWGLELPIVKKLWTSSFCLVTGGYSALLLGAFYLVVDVWEFQRWCRPFVWIGANPITIYLIVEVVNFQRIAERLVGGDIRNGFNRLAHGLGGLVVALVSLSLVLLLLRFLYQRKIFLRV